MKFNEKMEYLQRNHLGLWIQERAKQEEIQSNGQSMVCCCGRLATGLHESRCNKFQKLVSSKTVKALSHLIIKKG
jgi:hypothetical protein